MRFVIAFLLGVAICLRGDAICNRILKVLRFEIAIITGGYKPPHPIFYWRLQTSAPFFLLEVKNLRTQVFPKLVPRIVLESLK